MHGASVAIYNLMGWYICIYNGVVQTAQMHTCRVARHDVAEHIGFNALRTHDRILLDECDGVVCHPVDHKTRCEIAEHEHEDPRHPCEDHRLGFVGGGRIQLLLHPHGYTHQDREYADRENREETFRSRRREWQ